MTAPAGWVNKLGNRQGCHLFKHGMRRTRTYKIWCKMKERCTNPKAINYERYGALGISVCPEWMGSFETFLADIGECPPGLSIERLDNSKGYFKGNCKWSPVKEQNNNKRNSVIVEFSGERKTLGQWCFLLGLNHKRVYQRLTRNHWTPERAFQT